ncbi:MAG TPA: hypothetical protein VJ874_01310 [Candidatus Thermoplasmatota archaeon]|nr:hypothetical protein [Candidatus Thermoplasmatota archaeon]
MRRILALAGFVLVLIPSAGAHGPVNAKEVEVLAVVDELSDHSYYTGGYDLGEVYLGEAFVPAIGDGFYVHTVLFGTWGAALPGDTYEVAFRFTLADGTTIERRASTADGDTFESDFDELVMEAGTDEDEVVRGFIAFDDTVGPGDSIKGIVVESLVKGDVRDRAPGGVFVPGSQGMAEVPVEAFGESAQVITSYDLTGPTQYFTVQPSTSEGGFTLSVSTLLRGGDQHIMVELPDASTGWGLQGAEILSAEVKANGTVRFPIEVTQLGTSNATLRITSDIGGRVDYILSRHEGMIDLRPDAPPSQAAMVDLSQPVQETPGMGFAALVATIALAALRRR